MDSNREDSPALKVENVVKQSETQLPSNHEETKTTYKSFKKKYRKMRIKFDGKMQESNLLCAKEQLGAETARRLAQEHDQLLDLLLDVNSSAQIPADKRIELNSETPSISAVPPLISPDELSEASQIKAPTGQAIYKEIRAALDEKALRKVGNQPSKSLALLMSVTPHRSTSTNNLSPAVRENTETLDGYPGPLSYLTAEQLDDYLCEVDNALSSGLPPNPQTSPHHELALRNPHSVYNWLRRNEPKIFLQDGEGSEKSMGKPGSLRGAGKRASMPAPSKPDSLEIVEEDGMRYDPTISGLEPVKGSKRKREDDGGYHPKSGAPTEGKVKKSRPRKKKGEAASGEAGAAAAAAPPPTSSRKGKGKAAKQQHSSPAPDPTS